MKGISTGVLGSTQAATPAALVKPPLPGRERIVLRLVVLLALALSLAAPTLPELAERIPGQRQTGSRTPRHTTGLPSAMPPQVIAANSLRALSHTPALWVTSGIAAGGGTVLVLELALAAVGLVRHHARLHQVDATYLRVRTLRPQSRKGAARDTNPTDLWRQIVALESHLRSTPGAWIAWTLTGQPEQGATLGAVIGSRSGDSRALTQAIERVLAGADADLLVDTPPDPLSGAMRPGAVILWEELALTRPPFVPLHAGASAEADLLGALAAALRLPPGVMCADIQIVARPRREPNDATWRVRARRRLVDLRRRSAWSMGDEAGLLETKLSEEAFDLSVRLVVVAEDRRQAAAARATLKRMRSAFTATQQRGGLGVQRFTPVPFCSGMAHIRQEVRFAREVWWLACASFAGSVGYALRVALPEYTPGVSAVAALMTWITLCGAVVFRLTATQPVRLRAPRLSFPFRLMLPFPLWRSPSIVSTSEVAALWHLPDVRLRSLIEWLPNRHLSAQPHVFAAADDVGRIILGEARTRDGVYQPVGPTLRDLRQVMHITAGMGAGKSRALANMAEQLIQRLGSGLILLDGKGDDEGCLAATVRTYIPRSEEGRVILLDLLDAEWPIGLNPFYGIDTRAAGGATQALGVVLALLSRLDEDLARRSMGMVQYIQMATVLAIEGEDAPTFATLKQVLEDETYRTRLLQRCTNQEVVTFWRVTYSQTSDQQRNSLHALLRRFDNLLVDETTRYLLTQPQPTVDLLDAIEIGAIVLAPLPHRTLGGMAAFIGMLLLQAVTRAAFRRGGSDQTRSTVPLLVDELQVFLGTGDAGDIRDMVTQLRGFGIAGIYAHQALAQLGDLRDELLTNSASRLILRTQEPDATAFARQYPTTDLTAADIAGQHPHEHQYAVLASQDAPAEVFSLRPRLWPLPLDVDSDFPPYHGPDWRTAQPEGHDALDEAVLRLVYGPVEMTHVSAQLAAMPDDQWQLLLDSWARIRTCQRAYILQHPQCIPDRLERQRWLSRLAYATPRVLAAAVYQRQRWAIDPAEVPTRIHPRRAVQQPRDSSAPAQTARIEGITPIETVPVPIMPPLPPLEAALAARGRMRRRADSVAAGYDGLPEETNDA